MTINKINYFGNDRTFYDKQVKSIQLLRFLKIIKNHDLLSEKVIIIK